jgi:hypothetical protein
MRRERLLSGIAHLRSLVVLAGNGALRAEDRAALQQAYDRTAASLDLPDAGPAIGGRDVADPATVVALDEAAWLADAASRPRAALRQAEAATGAARIAGPLHACEVAERTRDLMLLDLRSACRAMAGRDPLRAIDLLG